MIHAPSLRPLLLAALAGPLLLVGPLLLAGGGLGLLLLRWGRGE